MSEVVNLASWKQRVNIADGARRMLDLAAAVPPEDANVWAEAQTLYEVTSRLSHLFQAAATYPNQAETPAETRLREACMNASDSLSDVCRSIEEAWISAYVVPAVPNPTEIPTVSTLRNAA